MRGLWAKDLTGECFGSGQTAAHKKPFTWFERLNFSLSEALPIIPMLLKARLSESAISNATERLNEYIKVFPLSMSRKETVTEHVKA